MSEWGVYRCPEHVSARCTLAGLVRQFDLVSHHGLSLARSDMTQINIHEAKTQLSRLVERAARGEEIVIARSGKPVAKLVPFDRDMTPRRPGSMRGLIKVPDDFDAPLPPEVLTAFLADLEPPA